MTKCEIIANGIILDLIRRAYTFGLNLAKLDIRQESSRHTTLINAICKKLGLNDYLKLSEDDKITFLSKEFNSKRPLIPRNINLNREDRETWETFKMISETSKECIGAYVISMCSKVSDILAVLLLQKEAGIKIPMKPHQLTILKAALELENKRIHIETETHNITLKSKFGVLCDSVGSGKSLDILAIIANILLVFSTDFR